MTSYGLKLDAFCSTDQGYALWDSPEVRLVYKNETVFILKMNEYVELDTLNLIDQDTSGFNKSVDEYVVTYATTIDEINYIFIEKEQ